MFLRLKHRSLSCVAAVGLAFGLGIGPVAADQEISLRQTVNPQTVIDLYLGKTWVWGEGGAYWGNNGDFLAATDDGLTGGKWYVTDRASLCFEGDWMSTAEDGSVMATPVKRCWKHAREATGQVWQHDSTKDQWYRLDTGGIVKGNKVAQFHGRKRAEMGI